MLVLGVGVGVGLLGTAVPIVLFVRGLDRIEASHASVIGTAEPLVTVVLGVVLLGETATPVLVVGGGLVLCGVLLIQRTSRPTGMVAH
ncbi:EamA family transporter [Halococcus sp. IIIV-5B]|uniref:EamA family transporter n=1 Tax=Halococcus sp. IIIV-5B TaxID=2321230 RepID=UPI0013144C16|nr:EamA family transporter [Halococcus sp. IIIV-5B]